MGGKSSSRSRRGRSEKKGAKNLRHEVPAAFLLQKNDHCGYASPQKREQALRDDLNG